MALQGKPKKKLNAEGLWAAALRALGGRAHSTAELRRKLALRAETPSALAEVMAKLLEYGLLDDKGFAEAYASARLEGQGLGSRRVLRDLQSKLVRREVAEAVVANVYVNTDEDALVEQYLERKLRGKDLPVYLAEEKNLASVYRRLRTAGFGSSASIRVLKRHAQRADELESLDESESGE